MNNFLRITLISFVAIITSFCKNPTVDNEPNNDNQGSNRTLMLSNIADEIVIPSYAKFKIKLDSFNIQINTFSNAPNESNLIALRNSWVHTYTEWQKVELFDFGPANNYALRNFLNIYPANPLAIRTNILDKDANLEYSVNETAQGFPAFDYLINGYANSDSETVSLYASTTDTIAPKRIAYLKKLGLQMSNKFNQTYNAWTSSYRKEFIESSNLTSTGSTSKMINGFILNYERYIRSGKIGIPAAALVGEKDETKVEAYYKKDISKQLAIAAHQASIDFFNGKSVNTGIEGFSIKSYLNGIDAKDSKTGKFLTETLIEQFTIINSKLNSLPNNFSDLVTTDNQKLIDTHDEFQVAVRMLKVDMSSAMSIIIGYGDTDGD